MKRHLIIFAKRPLAGHAKTRLGAQIGMEAAAGVYARLLYGLLLDLLSGGLAGTTLELSLASAADLDHFSQAFPELVLRPQVEGDLGQRIQAAFARAYEDGAGAVVLVGSDIPGLNTGIIEEAFQALAHAPAVIGPAEDGGYYLLGMRAPGLPLFEGVAWSTGRVLAQTLALAARQNVRPTALVELPDLDTASEFKAWQAQLRARNERNRSQAQPHRLVHNK